QYLEQEQQQGYVDQAAHTVFFKQPVSAMVAQQIESKVEKFLVASLARTLQRSCSIEVRYDASGPCLEMRFPTPINSKKWMDEFYAIQIEIDAQLCQIDTFNGLHWRPPNGR
ncbi:MAG TPA: hypothetical protein V6D22_05510, partial [Candidatus Obscuribacterales bacterium]